MNTYIKFSFSSVLMTAAALLALPAIADACPLSNAVPHKEGPKYAKPGEVITYTIKMTFPVYYNGHGEDLSQYPLESAYMKILHAGVLQDMFPSDLLEYVPELSDYSWQTTDPVGAHGSEAGCRESGEGVVTCGFTPVTYKYWGRTHNLGWRHDYASKTQYTLAFRVSDTAKCGDEIVNKAKVGNNQHARNYEEVSEVKTIVVCDEKPHKPPKHDKPPKHSDKKKHTKLGWSGFGGGGSSWGDWGSGWSGFDRGGARESSFATSWSMPSWESSWGWF